MHEPVDGLPGIGCGSRPLPNPPGAAPNSESGDDSGRHTRLPERVSGRIAAATSANRSVTFFGVPVLAPTTTGSRVFRITNVRVERNAFGWRFGFGCVPGSGFDLDQRRHFAADHESDSDRRLCAAGLTASVSGCRQPQPVLLADQDLGQYTYIYRELRYGVQDPCRGSEYNACMPVRSATRSQNVPGGIYNSESNFVFTGATNGSAVAVWRTSVPA